MTVARSASATARAAPASAARAYAAARNSPISSAAAPAPARNWPASAALLSGGGLGDGQAAPLPPAVTLVCPRPFTRADSTAVTGWLAKLR